MSHKCDHCGCTAHCDQSCTECYDCTDCYCIECMPSQVDEDGFPYPTADD